MVLRRIGIALLIVALGFTTLARADEPVLLAYKVRKGETTYTRIGSEMKQTQSIMGMKLNNTYTQDAVVSRVVDDVSEKGDVTYKLKAERRKVNSEMSALGGKYEFDSKSTERDTGSAIGAELTPLFERLTGSEYQVIVSPLGRVTEVKGFSELIADIVKDKPIAAQFGGGDNKSAAVAEQDSFVVLSDKPVRPGDKWESAYEVELPKIGKLKGKNTYTYEGPDKVGDLATARIGTASELTFELNLDQGGAKITGTLSTTSSSGTIQFDPAAGRVVSIKRTLSISGQMSVDVNGMTIPIDNQQEQTSTFELLPKLPD